MGKKNQKAMKKETEVNTRTKIIKKKKKTQIHQTNVLPGAACEQPAQSSQILGVKIRRGVDRFPRDRIHGLGFQFCRNRTWSEHIAGGRRGGRRFRLRAQAPTSGCPERAVLEARGIQLRPCQQEICTFYI